MHGFSVGAFLCNPRRKSHISFVAKCSLVVLTLAALTFLIMRCTGTMAVPPQAVNLRLLANYQPGPGKCEENSGGKDAGDVVAEGEVHEGLPENPKKLKISLDPIPWTSLRFEESLKVEGETHDYGWLGKSSKAALVLLRAVDGARLAGLVARGFVQEAIVASPLFRPQQVHLLQEPTRTYTLLVEKGIYRLIHYHGTPSTGQPADALLRRILGGLPPYGFAEVLDRLGMMAQAREVQLLQCPVMGHQLAQYNMLVQNDQALALMPLPHPKAKSSSHCLPFKSLR
ncbi:hypothetical protein Esti_001025 [Eimeria stiedai]